MWPRMRGFRLSISHIGIYGCLIRFLLLGPVHFVLTPLTVGDCVKLEANISGREHRTMLVSIACEYGSERFLC